MVQFEVVLDKIGGYVRDISSEYQFISEPRLVKDVSEAFLNRGGYNGMAEVEEIDEAIGDDISVLNYSMVALW